MPYKLLLSEQISPAVRRIAIEQLSAANRQLNVDDHMQAGVHEARIYLKKTRALLRLARPIIGKKRFRRWNCEVRDISRAIAHPRDVEALIETVDLLIPAKDFARSRPLLLATKELLLKDKKNAFHDFEVISFNNVTDRLNQAVGEWRTADLPEASFEGLAKGFTDGYRRGRQSLKTALKQQDGFYLHEWRKDVQLSWRHGQLLTLVWPEAFAPRIRLAREISHLLGLEHDLSALLCYLKSHKKLLKKQKNLKGLRKRFRQDAQNLQVELRQLAIDRGRRLYAFKPGTLEEALIIYWHSSLALQPLPNLLKKRASHSNNDDIDQNSIRVKALSPSRFKN